MSADLYAYTPTGYRQIGTPEDAKPGEAVAAQVPASVTDAISVDEIQRDANGRVSRANAEQALANLRTYRDTASPTNAQTAATVKLLCRVCIALTRLQLAKLESSD